MTERERGRVCVCEREREREREIKHSGALPVCATLCVCFVVCAVMCVLHVSVSYLCVRVVSLGVCVCVCVCVCVYVCVCVCVCVLSYFCLDLCCDFISAVTRTHVVLHDERSVDSSRSLAVGTFQTCGQQGPLNRVDTRLTNSTV